MQGATLLVVKAAKIELFGLNYSPRQGPDWDPKKCKPRSAIVQDLTLLQTITSRVRIYSLTDCDQGRVVLSVAKELGMKLWLGLWVSDIPKTFAAEQKEFEAMLEEGLLDDATIIGVHVGSEAIYREEVTAATAIANMEEIKAVLVKNGKPDLPVSIADIGDIYEANPSLLAAVDVVSANAFPFWEKKDADTAVDYLIERLRSTTIPASRAGKTFILSETGWSANGSDKAASEATPENQITYFKDFYCKIHLKTDWQTYYFTGIDSAWRALQDETEDGVEGHFGIYYADLSMKPHFKTLSFACDGSEEVHSFSDLSVAGDDNGSGTDGKKQYGFSSGAVHVGAGHICFFLCLSFLFF